MNGAADPTLRTKGDDEGTRLARADRLRLEAEVLAKDGRLAAALAAIEAALALVPDRAYLHARHGSLAWELGRLEVALASLDRAIALQPSYADAHRVRGVILDQAGQTEAGIAALERAIALVPNSALPVGDLARVLLANGRYLEAWPFMEARRRDQAWMNAYPGRGAALTEIHQVADGPVLVSAEQGYGDTIQFCRFVPLLADHGADIVFVAPVGLAQILGRLPGARMVTTMREVLPPYARHVPLMSLPGLLGTTVQNIPASVPYLRPDPRRVEVWRQRLGPRDGSFRIAVSWHGNPAFVRDAQRSFPLSLLTSIAAVPGVRLLCIQQGHGREQLAQRPSHLPIDPLAGDLDFEDTAAILSLCDLVVSCDSAPAHLAGALGRPVWIALPDPSDWRWMRHRSDSPWYPSARLFRQPEPGNWESVFAAMAAELPALMRRSSLHRRVKSA